VPTADISTTNTTKKEKNMNVNDLQSGIVLGVIGALALTLSEKYIGVGA
jgi:hypothetical protein